VEPKFPAHRRLIGFAFDPSLSLSIDTAHINVIKYKVRWEKLEPGPIGEYIEVIDYDPTVKHSGKKGVFYKPVDLDRPEYLVTDGVKPSESNPQFHQQMVYAVAMTTIENFELALGRPILWAEQEYFATQSQYSAIDREDHEDYDLDKSVFARRFTQRLRIYPHAHRRPNAYYSPKKKALLFGYFNASPANSSLHMPGSMVFTALSHDIITHEVTHAILDGLHPRYNENTNPDVLAFHEAFADITALFQHFSFPEVLKDQIARTQGDLGKHNLMTQLAQEFGKAVGRYGSLRDAIGTTNEQNEWVPVVPSPTDYIRAKNPHERGSILVAAIFESFLSIYKRRTRDLIKIATNGSGVLPEGEIHPELTNRLSYEAAKTASHILTICIRALDYCPPIDITFGDYLRALITADRDVVSNDKYGYRIAIIESFKKRGIYPQGVKILSEESLCYDHPDNMLRNHPAIKSLAYKLRLYRNSIRWQNKENTKDYRKRIFLEMKRYISGYGKSGKGIHESLSLALQDKSKKASDMSEFIKAFGIAIDPDQNPGGIKVSKQHYQNGNIKSLTFAVEQMRIMSKISPNGTVTEQIMITLVQTARFNFNANNQRIDNAYNGKINFRGGTTLIFDLNDLSLKYCITKPLVVMEDNQVVLNEKRFAEQMKQQRANLFGIDDDDRDLHPKDIARELGLSLDDSDNPFFMLHN